MKIAISLPDPLYRRADREARRRKLSRSGIVAEALAEYFRHREGAAVTAALDRVEAALTARERAGEAKARRGLQRAAFRSLGREKW